MTGLRPALIWAAVAAGVAVPLGLAAASPLLAWRDPVYIGAGFAGILAMAALLVQPLLATGALPGLSARGGRWLHRVVGAGLVGLVVVHVGGLWITSPPDVVDALLFVSPTPFAVWGVIAMWSVFAAAIWAALRRPLRLRWRVWRSGHLGLALLTVAGTVIHALLIEGTMETVSKLALSALVVAALASALLRRGGASG